MDVTNALGGELDLSSDASQAMLMRYSAVATSTLWLYEYLLTFDEEIRLIWPSRLTIIKFLFLANRYLPLSVTSMDAYFLIANKPSDEYMCKPALMAIGYMAFTSFFLAEVVLVLRVYVIWQARKSILFIVIFALSAKTSAAFVITHYYLDSAIISPINLFRYGCEGIFEKRIEWISMVLIFSFEIVILSLMIIGKRVHFRRSRSEIVHILVGDGVLYCLSIMAVSLVNIFVVRLAPMIMSPFLIVTQGTVHNILCTRLLLRLRVADDRRRSALVQNYEIPMVASKNRFSRDTSCE